MDAVRETRRRCLNRDAIKYIAMLTMLLNHISNIFLESGGFVSELFLDIGYFTAPVMCYFLVEGYQYTRSKKKYACRLLFYALISEIPYCLAFTENGRLEFCGMNMLFTLFLCFCILYVSENGKSLPLKVLSILALTLASLVSDWALLAPVFTLLFSWGKASQKKLTTAFGAAAGLFGLFYFAGGMGRFPLKTNLLYALGSMSGVVLAGIAILWFYNGRRMERGKTFSKWFFYWFYPVHLLALGLIRISLL